MFIVSVLSEEKAMNVLKVLCSEQEKIVQMF